MIHPNVEEILATIQASLNRDIIPALSDIDAISSAATIEHLLRYLAVRIDKEGEMLAKDIHRLERLLEKASEWFDETGIAPDARIKQVAELNGLNDGIYNSVRDLGERVLALRHALALVQQHMKGAIEPADQTPVFFALREDIRVYIAQQLQDEAELIEPAFFGRGPRR